MSNEPLFNIIYAGAILAGFNEGQVKDNFISKLNIPEEKVARLFSGKSIILKKSLSKEMAEKWRNRLLIIGAEVAMVPVIIPTPEMATNLDDKVEPTPENSSNMSASQSEYDEDMQQRINKAKAMIAAQIMEQQMNAPKEDNLNKRLLMYSVVLTAVVFVLYFYAESIT